MADLLLQKYICSVSPKTWTVYWHTTMGFITSISMKFLKQNRHRLNASFPSFPFFFLLCCSLKFNLKCGFKSLPQRRIYGAIYRTAKCLLFYFASGLKKGKKGEKTVLPVVMFAPPLQKYFKAFGISVCD